MPRSGWQLIRDGFPDRPELGPALSRVLLEQVATGRRPATVRLSRPGRAIAFGRRDVVSPNYREAAKVAAEHGFPGMERISGGRAAAFSEGALSLTLTVPDARPASRTGQRFRIYSEILRQSFADLGVDARIGAIPGEYCPGEFSINAAGRIKLAGVGQRMISGAAHVGFVIMVTGSDPVREVLGPVYEALGLEFDGDTVGAIEDAVGGTGLDETEEAILRRLRQHLADRGTSLEPVGLDAPTFNQTEERGHLFRSPAKPE